MANPFVGEIRIFPFNFAPIGWALCDGQLLPISQNTALFSLLGTTYGGNGTSDFALPNLQASAPMNFGQGAGLSDYDLGQSGGTSTVTLSDSELPAHSHSVGCVPGDGTQRTPANAVFAATPEDKKQSFAYSKDAPSVPMSASALGDSGESQPHNNLQPYLVLNFCIALQGIFPARS
jgi:microcystin-dependent protein